jgi:hypothetical protein
MSDQVKRVDDSIVIMGLLEEIQKYKTNDSLVKLL